MNTVIATINLPMEFGKFTRLLTAIAEEFPASTIVGSDPSTVQIGILHDPADEPVPPLPLPADLHCTCGSPVVVRGAGAQGHTQYDYYIECVTCLTRYALPESWEWN